jgi:hypothetical protein
LRLLPHPVAEKLTGTRYGSLTRCPLKNNAGQGRHPQRHCQRDAWILYAGIEPVVDGSGVVVDANEYIRVRRPAPRPCPRPLPRRSTWWNQGTARSDDDAKACSPKLRSHIIRVWFQTAAATYSPIDATQHHFHVPRVVGFLPAPSPRWGCPAGSAVRARPSGTALALHGAVLLAQTRGRCRCRDAI